MIENNIDYRANNKGAKAKVENQEACAKLSFSREGALFWTFQPSTKLCWPKTNKAGRMAMENVVSGNIECGRSGKLDTQNYTKLQPFFLTWMCPPLPLF